MKVKLTKKKHSELKRLIKVDENNVQIDSEPIFVRLEEVASNVDELGTPITEAVLEQINWRDENEIIVTNRADLVKPIPLSGKTQICVLNNGQVWVIPAQGCGENFRVSEHSDPIIKSVITQYRTDKLEGETGLKVTNGVLELGIAQEVIKDSDGNEIAHRGAISIKGENGLKVNSGILTINKAGSVSSDQETNHGTVQVIQENGLKLNKGTIKINRAGSVTSDSEVNHGTVQVIQENGLKLNKGTVKINVAGKVNFDSEANHGTVQVIADNGLTLNKGTIKINKAGSAGSDSDTKHGTVQVIEANGLSVNSGTIRMNLVDSTNPGAITAGNMNLISKYIKPTSVSNWNDATISGIYHGNYPQNGPQGTPESFIGQVIGVGEAVYQFIVGESSLNSWSRIRVNGTWHNWINLTTNEKVLYEGTTALINTPITFAGNPYSLGYRKLRIEVYADDSSYDAYSDNKYFAHGSCEITLFPPASGGDSLSNNFNFITDITDDFIRSISGKADFSQSSSLMLTARSKMLSNNFNTNDSATKYRIKVTGIR